MWRSRRKYRYWTSWGYAQTHSPNDPNNGFQDASIGWTEPDPRVPRSVRSRAVPGLSRERLKGLEPSTFCMASGTAPPLLAPQNACKVTRNWAERRLFRFRQFADNSAGFNAVAPPTALIKPSSVDGPLRWSLEPRQALRRPRRVTGVSEPYLRHEASSDDCRLLPCRLAG
jgi:hypothetical protein